MIPALLVSVALATTYTPVTDLDQLIALSDGAVHGHVKSLSTARIDGMIWTIATVAPRRGGPVVPVRLLGGCLEGVCMTVPGAPRVEVGEEVFILLHAGQPTHFSDGVFHVRGDEAWTDLAAVSHRDGHTPVVQAPLEVLLDAAAELLPDR